MKLFKTLSLLLILSLTSVVHAQYPESKLDWKLGTQAFTFNQFTFFEAVDKTKASGLKYIEAFPGQTIGGGIEGKMDFEMPKEKRKAILKELKKRGVTLMAFGVVVPDSEEKWRELFEFAKDMKIKSITSEPKPEDLPFISKLCDEFKIKLAIHNHPNPSRYWDPNIVLDAIAGLSERVGACADVGHWVRSGLDPVECIKKLDGRIVSLHFKDLHQQAKDAHDVPWGTGVSNIKGIMQQLAAQDFEGLFSVEYEYKWENNVPEIIESVAYFRKEVERIKAE